MTLQELQALYANRKKLTEDSRSFLDGIHAEKRDMTDEENERYDRMYADIDKLTTTINKEEKQREAERSIVDKFAKDTEENRDTPQTNAEQRAALVIEAARSFIKSGRVSQEHYNEWQGFQERALSSGLDTEGGYLVMPEQFANELIEAVKDIVIMRQFARTFKVNNATSLGIPSLDTRPDDADWTVELATGSEDSAMAFGKRVLKPHPLGKLVKVSRELLRESVMPVEQILMEQLAFKFGVAEEKGFLVGTGSNQPLGVFTAHANGISTGRDVSTGNTTSSIATDGIKEAKYSLKQQYQMSPSTAWIFHRDAVKQISKLKDGEGRYLWEDSIKVGTTPMLEGIPVMQSEFAPNTFTTGLYVGLLGDMRNYWIADSLDYSVQRLNELYAVTNQVGFIGRKATDGMPVLEEAFARVTLA